MTKVIINSTTHGSHQPARLAINGNPIEIPVNVETSVTDDQLEALKNSDLTFTIVEGDTAADEADQAPAPAGSGGGGDAGGGGKSGAPAADTSLALSPEAEAAVAAARDAAKAAALAEGKSEDEADAAAEEAAAAALAELHGQKVDDAALPANFLDRSVVAIIPDLADLNPAQLECARAAEEGGKTRKSLIAAIDERVAALAAA